jgi:hypothetical protein
VTQLDERFKALRGTLRNMKGPTWNIDLDIKVPLRDLLGLECLVYIILIKRVELGYLVDWELIRVGKG